ncbi:MAG: RsmE family RNA methyltransferase [Patescibacteria group bacterium]
MKLHRFIGKFDLNKKELVIDDKDFAHQVTKVLRMQTGQALILCDGYGREAVGRIDSIDKKSVTIILEDAKEISVETSKKVFLFCAVLKRENFELVVQKATEVGVWEIVPIITERTVKQSLKMDRVRLIAKEAAEQSGRGHVPLVNDPIPLASAMERARDHEVNYFYDLNIESEAPTQKNPQRAGVWIGPEGGWSDMEVEQAKRAGFLLQNLGSLTLRAETAAIVASYMACN